MGKHPSSPPSLRQSGLQRQDWPIYAALLLLLAICQIAWVIGPYALSFRADFADFVGIASSSRYSPYRRFPAPGDPFHLIACTNTSILPALDDSKIMGCLI